MSLMSGLPWQTVCGAPPCIDGGTLVLSDMLGFVLWIACRLTYGVVVDLSSLGI